MLNQIVLVGRIVSEPKIEKSEDNKSRSLITIAVPRSYKNADGVYETDFIDCVLWNSIAENTVEYCKKGDLIGVKGRVHTSTYENEAGETKKSMQVVAERITFLSSKKEKDDEVEKSDDDLEM